MTKIRKKFDEGIRLNPSTTEGTKEGELWVDDNDKKLKIFLDNTVQEFTTTSEPLRASQVSFDNSSGVLVSSNLQDAIDEIKLTLDALALIPSVPKDPFSIHIVQPPTNVKINNFIIPEVSVKLKDEDGVDVFNNNIITVTLSVNGVLTGTTEVSAVNGVATFSDIQITQVGAYTMTFTSPGLESATTSIFGVTNPAELLGILDTSFSPWEAGLNNVETADVYGNRVAVGSSNTNIALTVFDLDGNIDTDFMNNVSPMQGPVYCVKFLSDGSLLVGGGIYQYEGNNRDRFIKLNPDGTLDTTFTDNTSGSGKFVGTVYAIEELANGNIVVGGDLLHEGIRSVVRFNSLGLVQERYNINANVYKIKSTLDGGFLFSGNFSNFLNLSYIDGVVKIDGTLSLDNTFHLNVLTSGGSNTFTAGGELRDIDQYPDGRYLIDGRRFLADGTLDTSFPDQRDSFTINGSRFKSVTCDSSGYAIYTGLFRDFGGVSGRNHIVRVDENGVVDETFTNNASGNNSLTNFGVYGAIENPNGKLYLFGHFVNYNLDNEIDNIVRLD